MKIPLVDGSDFRISDTTPGVTIVNNAFVRQFFKGENPIGKSFVNIGGQGERGPHHQVVGVLGDALYVNLRESMQPVAYFLFKANFARGTFIVRTSGSNPLAMASSLRQEVARARPGFRVSNIRTQTELNQSSTVRERLLATLALFFGGVALLLAGVGLYGVLNYSVFERRREIGIRMAIGAQAGDIARRVTVEVFSMVLLGSLAGLALGMVSVRSIETLFYGVTPTAPSMLALPSLAIFAAALLAALPPVIRAVRIDPVQMLRSE